VFLIVRSRCFRRAGPAERPLARFIHDHEDTKGLFCYKHVVETVFVVVREAFA
jgi:hypothetical protein